MKIKLNRSVILFMLCLCSFSMWAQNIGKPEFFINDPDDSTGDLLCITDLGGGNGGVERSGVSKYSGPSNAFPVGTIFTLELSEPGGSFDDFTELGRTVLDAAITNGQDIIVGPFDILPEYAGSDYSIRMQPRTSAGEAITQGVRIEIQEGFDIFFFSAEEGARIVGPNTEANDVALCPGSNVDLEAFPKGFDSYEWLVDVNGGDNFVPIAGETGDVLRNVSQAGRYRVQISFGDCTGEIGFNKANIDVFRVDQATVFIEPPAASEFCPGQAPALRCSIRDNAYTYTWYRNGEEIPDSNNHTLSLPQSNFGGTYTLIFDSGECSETTQPVVINNLGSDITSRPPEQMIILPNETITLTIETNADLATSDIFWTLDGAAIPGTDNLLSIDIGFPGVYRVVVDANDSCPIQPEAVISVYRPVGFKTDIDQLIDCEDDIVTLGLVDLLGITDSNLEVPLTENQYAFFEFEWFRDATATGITDLSIEITDPSDTSTYSLDARFTAGGFPETEREEIQIDLLEDDITITASEEFLPVNGSVELSVPNSALYNYQWSIEENNGNFRDIENATENTISVEEEGNYRVIITYEDCEIELTYLLTREPSQSAVIPNVIAPDGTEVSTRNWVLPGEFNTPEVQVSIYSANGQLDFQKSGGYREEWPLDSRTGASELLYYYIITKNNEVVRKGTITVMR